MYGSICINLEVVNQRSPRVPRYEEPQIRHVSGSTFLKRSKSRHAAVEDTKSGNPETLQGSAVLRGCV